MKVSRQFSQESVAPARTMGLVAAWNDLVSIQRAVLAAREASGVPIATRAEKGLLQVGYFLSGADHKLQEWIALSGWASVASTLDLLRSITDDGLLRKETGMTTQSEDLARQLERAVLMADDQAPQSHLAAGRSVYYGDPQFPGQIVRENPNGSRQIVSIDESNQVHVIRDI